MQLKLYRAAAMPEAMARIRRELGADALILDTRRVHGGVEITAALEAPGTLQAAPDPARRPALARHNLPERLLLRLAAGPLPFALSAAFRFAPLPPPPKPLLLIGPPGAGKTLTVARLATRLVLAGARPMVITADAQRAGAVEQLAAFTRLLGLTLATASQPASLRKALSTRAPDAPALIDTPAWSPSDPAPIQALAEAADAAIALVLPAGLDPAEATDLAEAARGLGATHLIATRLDTTFRLAGVLAAADAGLAFAEAGIGPAAADSLVPLTPDFLATRLGKR